MNHMLSDCRRTSGGILHPSLFAGRLPLPRGTWLILVLLITGITVTAYSQDPPQPNESPAEAKAQEEKDPDLQGSFSRSIVFLRDRELEARLRGAQTAFTLGRSVDAVQILAELLALPEPHNIQVGSSLRDVRDEAAAILRNGPEELREQFRRQTEVRAADELKNALADGDIPELAAITARYPFTPVARECVETLVTQFYDHGRYDAVIQAASRWIDRNPDPHLAASQSPLMFALWRQALVEVGAVEQANALVLRFSNPPGMTPTIPEPAAEKRPPSLPSPATEATAWGVPSELPDTVRDMLGTVLDNLSRQGIHPSLSLRPLILDKHVLWRSLTELICVERVTGEVLWRKPILDSTVSGIVQMGETKADGNRIISLRSQLGHRVLRNSILGQITCDGERVYTVEYSPVIPGKPEPQPQPAQNNNLPPEADRVPIPEMTFVAYSLADGSVQWKSHEVWEPGQSQFTYFLGPPVSHGKSLYAVIQHMEQLKILRMDPATGKVDGASVLGEVPHLADDRRRLSEACPILWHDGVAICATGAGGIAAFDMYRGQLQWGFRHKRDDVIVAQGLLMPPVDKSGWTWMTGWEQPQVVRLGTNVIYGSPETNRLRCLDISNGDLKWEVPIAGCRAVVGGDDERVILEGAEVARSLRLKDGSVEREFLPPEQVTSSAWLGSVCRLTLVNGEQIDWSPQTGLATVLQSPDADQPRLYAAGTFRQINGEAEQTLSRSLPVRNDTLVTRVDGIALRPTLSATATSGTEQIPNELVWQAGQSPTWAVALEEWIKSAPDGERAARVTQALAEVAKALESDEPFTLPISEWATNWSLPPDQVREITFRSLQNAMRSGQNLAALKQALRLLELQPADWETELAHARWGKTELGMEAAVDRTVRLDAALRGALQELWERTPPTQLTELEATYREWAERDSTVLDELTQPLEQLSFLPPPARERPLQWKTLSELARQQLSLRHLSTHENRATAAAALWRLVELHMARGEWGNAAGLIEQLKRQFASVTVRGNQTADELIKQLPENSLVLKSIDRDRRTAWPEREPTVSLIESSREPESQQLIPVRAERGSIFDHLNLSYATRQLQFSGLGKVHRSWALSLPGGRRNLWQQYPAIKAGWAFGQFVVVQFGSELYCLSSLDSKGEAKTSKIREVVLWPAVKKNAPPSPIDTLGNEDNEFTYESRLIPQVKGFVRRETEPFDTHGHRAAWVGPVSAGTLCFLQQGMLVCLDTATGQELWRRYDVPAGTRTVGDDSVVVLLRDGSRTVELLSPVDGRTVASYESEHAADDWIRTWGRNALVASGQPGAGEALNPVAPAPVVSDTTAPSPAAAPLPAPVLKELQLKMVDLSGPKTLWERTFPAGSAAFEVDEDWLGVISIDSTLSFLDVRTGQTVRESKVSIPAGLTQIATAVTERSIFVTFSPPVTENALVGSKPVKLKSRQFYVNGPVHAFDRQSGEYQWSQQIENRVFSIDQVRDIPLLICVDTWKGPLAPMPEIGRGFPKLEGTAQKADDPNALRVRYWAVDTRTGRVVLNTAIEKSMIQYTVERNLAEGWVEIRLGRTGFRFSYQDEAKTAQPTP